MTQEVGAECPAMAILPILEASDPRLRVLATLVTTIDAGLRALIADMVEPMDDAPESGWPFKRS